MAGVFSAFGLLLAEVRHDFVIGLGGNLDDIDSNRVVQAFRDSEVEARRALNDSCGGTPPGVLVERFVAMRYAYQIGEIDVRLDNDISSREVVPQLRKMFLEAHEREFGFRRDKGPIEIQNLRLTVTSTGTGAEFRSVAAAVPASAPPLTSTRKVTFGSAVAKYDVPVLTRREVADRSQLLVGPLLIDEDDTTIVVPPRWQVSCHNADWVVVMEHVG
jgi:N-methylhydantoinase A